MRSWKKTVVALLAGAAMTASTLLPVVVSAAPAATLVDQADISAMSDAEGTADVDVVATNGADTTYSTGSGTWMVRTGGSDLIGAIKLMENRTAVRLFQNLNRQQTLYASYVTNEVISADKTVASFAFYSSPVVEGVQNGFFTISSANQKTVQPTTETDAVQNDMGFAWNRNIIPIYDDSVTLVMLNTKFFCLQYAANTDTYSLKEVPGVSVAKNTKYYVRVMIDPRTCKCDLYFSNHPIGAADQPVLSGFDLVSPTGMPIQRFDLRRHGGDGTFGERRESITVSDLSFAQIPSDEKVLVDEDFEDWTEVPANQPNNALFGWYTRTDRGSGSRPRPMGSAEVADVNGGKALKLTKDTSAPGSTTAPWNGVLQGRYSDLGMQDYETTVTDLTFVSEPEDPTQFAQNITLTALLADQKPVSSGYEGAGDYAQIYPNSATLLMNSGKFYYCDENDKAFTEITAVPYQANTTYYLRFVVDNVARTFDMYLSQSPITEESVPVVADKPLVAPSEDQAAPYQLYFNLYDDNANSNPYLGNSLTIDDLRITGSNETTEPVPEGIQIADDSGAVLTDSFPADTAYLALSGLPTDKAVLAVMYDDAGTLLRAWVGASGAESWQLAIPEGENPARVSILIWDTLSGRTPSQDPITLTVAGE